MFNLNDTSHEAGILIYGHNSVIVCNWGTCEDNYIPIASPFGTLMPWPYPDEDGEKHTLIEDKHVDDVRSLLPGTVWMDDEDDMTCDTDMDIVSDKFGDLSALFGIKTGDTDPALYTDPSDPAPYSGTLWRVSGIDDVQIITLDSWN